MGEVEVYANDDTPLGAEEEPDSQRPKDWIEMRPRNRLGLTIRRVSEQRKNACHSKHLPSRTLDTPTEIHPDLGFISSVLPYATLRMPPRTPRSPTEDHAMKIASHMELDDDLMQDDPMSEQLRIETLRDMPQCLTVKRSIKAKLTMSVSQKSKRKPISFWKRLKYTISMSFMKIGMAMREVASTMELWYHSIKCIEGHFGSGVATYFKFLRWLFTVNVICCVFSIGFITVPQSLLGVYGDTKFSGLDLLTGSGFFTDTIMYYGFYSNGTISDAPGQTYSMPSAYFMTLLCCYIFTFILLSVKVARSYRKCFIETAGGLHNLYANKIFCGWDFGIASSKAANLRSASLYGELNELLGDGQERSYKDCASRSYATFVQIAITALVLTIMAATGYLLWRALDTLGVENTNTLSLLTMPLIFTFIMNIFPALFSWLVIFEGYTGKRTALYVTMVRIYAMEVIVVGILLAYWLTNSTSGCWQTRLAQELYRLVLIDFFVSIVGIFMAQMIRSKLHATIWRDVVKAPRFDIARNTLNLIYNQTLFWVAFYFSPMMSVVIVVKMMLTFHIKKYGVLNHCEPPSRSWRAAQTQTVFLALSFLGIVGVLMVLGYVFTNVSTIECGPFRGQDYTWEVIIEGVLRLRRDSAFWRVVTELGRPGIGALILISMGVGVYYLRAKAGARREMVRILREMLVMEAHDKEFLLSGITKVTDEQWMYHANPGGTPRNSVATRPNEGHIPSNADLARRGSAFFPPTPRPSAASVGRQDSPERSSSFGLSGNSSPISRRRTTLQPDPNAPGTSRSSQSTSELRIKNQNNVLY